MCLFWGSEGVRKALAGNTDRVLIGCSAVEEKRGNSESEWATPAVMYRGNTHPDQATPGLDGQILG